MLDESLTVQMPVGQVRFAPVGSTAVRDFELETQPLVGLQGTSTNWAASVGRPDDRHQSRSDYGTGPHGALLTLERDKVAAHQLVRG